jgi:DNA-binding CsgD family transcriptional regulator
MHDAAGVGERLMEASDRPMVLIERTRSVLATNAAARRYLEGDAPLAVRDGYLVGRTASADAALERALERLTELQLREPGGPARRVAARVPARTGDFAWCTLWDLAPESSLGAFGQRRAILLSVAPRTRAVSLDPMVVSAMFELTPAETRIAIALAQGDDLAAIAQALHLSLATVRSQLKAIFAKSGVHRQADLVQLLIRMNAT